MEHTDSNGGAAFPGLQVQFSDNAWGPQELPEQFSDMPYAPFSKGDRLGKVADFGGYTRQYGRHFRYGRDENAEIGYRHDTRADRTFELVDDVKVPKRKGPGPRRGKKDAPVAGDRGWEDKGAIRLTRQEKKILQQGSNMNKRRERLNRAKFQSRRGRPHTVRVHREASVKVTTDWNNLEQFDLNQLSKLQTSEPSVDDMKWAGRLAEYQEGYDRITSRTKKHLSRFENRDFYYVSAREDPVLQELSAEEQGNVFATDAVLSHLMTCTRSVYPWDIVITYVGGMIFLDVRDPLDFEMHSVNETARVPPPEDEEHEGDINNRPNLELEATTINQNFTQQVLNGPTKLDDVKLEDNPFWDDEEAEEGHEPANLAYRYRRWKLGNDINLVARTTVNAATTKRGQHQFMTVYALHEWDPKASGTTPWRKNIDTQRGAVLATEVQNNAFKLAKWTAATLLAGADQMKIGFVSRVNSKSPDNHVILGTQMYAPDAFAHQLSLNSVNMWGVLKWLVELVRKHAENLRDEDTAPEEHICKFVLLKDPNHSNISLYTVPFEMFESDEEESDEESDEDEDESE